MSQNRFLIYLVLVIVTLQPFGAQFIIAHALSLGAHQTFVFLIAYSPQLFSTPRSCHFLVFDILLQPTHALSIFLSLVIHDLWITFLDLILTSFLFQSFKTQYHFLIYLVLVKVVLPLFHALFAGFHQTFAFLIKYPP